jgi:hypothetical protein
MNMKMKLRGKNQPTGKVTSNNLMEQKGKQKMRRK